MREIAILAAPWREPTQILAAFAEEPWTLGLLSGGDGVHARWSYLARRPDRVLVVKADDAADPFAALSALLGPTGPAIIDGPPFQGGVAGYCAYELGARAEAMPLGRLEGWPDLACARYPAVLAFDHAERRLLAIGRADDHSRARTQALEALSWLDAATDPAPGPEAPLAAPLACEPSQVYQYAVADVVHRIERGEIFQANIARRWRGRLAPDARPFDLLARLIAASPAPFAAYLRLTDRAIVSNSPERFVRVTRAADGLRAETRPIKGTRPRGRTPDEDARNGAALHAAAKDRAENLMIVDLMRNDLSRVCRPGSVKTPDLFRLESFANVHHLVSTVTGTLSQGRGAIDLLRACLPPGSITGAPKLQAMKVIAGHEAPRGPFFGAMFWAGFDGALDSSVLIRTAAFIADASGWSVETRAGGGIVADSDPVAERRETEAKIGAILRALMAEEVGDSPAP
jgi:para-aminobenzoate synthetase component 1